ncbi:MbcA/ParS/Xre antitoxin family protein [Nostoc sp. CHAB 5834]|nr:MbcA/ParS/Xre antitoxin family protein [Nostoc sp. CHAB 5834]
MNRKLPDVADVSETQLSADLEGFFNIAELWKLSTDDQLRLLGAPARSTFFKWKKDGGSIPADTQERISHIFAIFKALEILIPDTEVADSWIRRSNSYFDEQSALDVMLGGQVVDIYRIRQYLDAQRGF